MSPRAACRATRSAWWVLCLFGLACRTVRGPAETLTAYAEALERGEFDRAYALLSEQDRRQETAGQFAARYRDAEARSARAQALRAAAGGTWTADAGAQLRQEAPGEWRVDEGSSQRAAAEAASRFLAAAERQDFEAAYRLMASPWRARYTPRSLAADFQADPSAKDRLARARQALKEPPAVRGKEIAFPLGGERALRLLQEGAEWKVSALE